MDLLQAEHAHQIVGGAIPRNHLAIGHYDGGSTADTEFTTKGKLLGDGITGTDIVFQLFPILKARESRLAVIGTPGTRQLTEAIRADALSRIREVSHLHATTI